MSSKKETEQINNPNIIRKLGFHEQFFHEHVKSNGLLNASTFKLSTSIDLFAHKEVISQSVKYWMHTQPFLCSRVVSFDDSDYFAYIFDEKTNNMDNITYLYFRNESKSQSIKEDCKDYWKLLIEREFTIPINWKDGPMWRLMFIQLRTNETANKFEYCLIITATHSIFDGHSAFQSLINLLFIIENVYTNKLSHQDQIKKEIVAVSVEQTVMAQLKKQTNNIGRFNKLNGFLQPEYFLVKNIHTDRKVLLTINEIDLNGAFYSASDHSQFTTLRSLFDLSLDSITKIYFFTFTGNKFKKFLEICKTKRIKITGVINMIFILAWRKVYEILNKDNQTSSSSMRNKIYYSTAVSLRPYLNDVNTNALCWLATTLYSSFEQETNYSASDFWNTKFWELAQENSEQFHSRLKHGEQFNIFQPLKPLNTGESRTHFGLSNLIVPKQTHEHLKLFKIDELYTTGSARKGREDNLTFNNMININDSLFWTLSFNSYFIKNETVKLFQDSVLDIYDKLCDLI